MKEDLKSQFIEYFAKGVKKKTQLKIGVEHERFLFTGKDKKRIEYPTLKKLLENLKSVPPINKCCHLWAIFKYFNQTFARLLFC